MRNESFQLTLRVQLVELLVLILHILAVLVELLYGPAKAFAIGVVCARMINCAGARGCPGIFSMLLLQLGHKAV